MRYKWAAEVAVLLPWPFIWCPWIISGEGKKSWNVKEVWAAISRVSGDEKRKTAHAPKKRKKRQESKRRVETPEEPFKFPTTL